jgi:NYN domain
MLMDRYALLIDAGYFYAAGAQALTGNPTTPRRHISIVSPALLFPALEQCAVTLFHLGATILRSYWYDAIRSAGPSLEQEAIAQLSGVKLRLGTINTAGEQKGVDSLIVTDLIELARNRAISDAVIVAGDEDLRVAVQVAQTFGVRVHVLAVGNPVQNVSPRLRMEADSVATLDSAWLTPHLTVAVPSPATPAAGAAPVGVMSQLGTAGPQVCNELAVNMSAAEAQLLKVHFSTNTNVPPEYDRRLLALTRGLVGRNLSPDEMRGLRRLFLETVRRMP